MLKIALFCVFAPFAAMEMLFYHQFGLIIVGTLYIGLSMQADFAAGRFLTRGLERELVTGSRKRQRRHWSEDEPELEPELEEEELRVQKLGKKRQASQQSYQPPQAQVPAPEPKPARGTRFCDPEDLEVKRTNAGIGVRNRTGAKPLPPSPNFRGQAHEVLGINENAATRTILHAFRHWVKRFHPDHAHAMPMELANAKVRQLTNAKVLLLERRRGKKAA